MHTHNRKWVHVVLVSLTLSSPVFAQSSTSPASLRFSLFAGKAQVDGSGVQSGLEISIRAARDVGHPWVVAEVGANFIRLKKGFLTGARHYFLPEALLQLQRPKGTLRPYAGVGAGFATEFGNRVLTHTSVAVAAAVGLRASMRKHFGAQIDLRARGIGSEFSASSAEAALGLSYIR